MVIWGFAIAIVFLALASYYDIFNRRTIPDWISYAFVVVALTFMLATEGIVLVKIGVAIAIFSLGYLLYRIGYIGGADVFFLAGLVLLLPLTGTAGISAALPTIVTVLFISTILMAVYLEYNFFAQRNKFEPKMQEIVTSIIWIIGYSIVSYVLYSLGLVSFAALALLVGIVSAVFALIKKDLAKSLVTFVAPTKIIEEDILAVEEMDPKIVEKLGLERLLTRAQIEKIKKAGLKSVPIYGKLPPYMPFMLIGTIVGFLLFLSSG